jgi:HPt (histidine-containing phosphotransfer) domain-containing protein
MVDHELNELRREFLDEAREKVDEMKTAVEGLGAVEGLSAAQAVERLAYLAHQLKGSGGSYGYQRISDDAAEIEKAAESLPSTNGTHESIEAKIRGHVTNIRTAIDEARAELR